MLSHTISKSTPKIDLSIILPVYNEEKTLLNLINRLQEVDFGVYSKEVIIVDDGSNDKTPSIIKNINNVKVITLPKNRGKGFAVRSGIAIARGKYVIIQDADLEYNPEDIKKLFLFAIENNNLAIVYGSRILENKNKRGGFFYYRGGKLISWFTNILFATHITDEPTCYKLFRCDVLKKMNLKAKGFEFCPEVTAKSLRFGFNIAEIPISYNPRTFKEGKKIKLKDGFQAIYVLIKYRFIPQRFL